MHYRTRTYDPRLGRFLQVDPVRGNRATEHYAYAGNDPVARTDPSGNYWVIPKDTPDHYAKAVMTWASRYFGVEFVSDAGKGRVKDASFASSAPEEFRAQFISWSNDDQAHNLVEYLEGLQRGTGGDHFMSVATRGTITVPSMGVEILKGIGEGALGVAAVTTPAGFYVAGAYVVGAFTVGEDRTATNVIMSAGVAGAATATPGVVMLVTGAGPTAVAVTATAGTAATSPPGQQALDRLRVVAQQVSSAPTVNQTQQTVVQQLQQISRAIQNAPQVVQGEPAISHALQRMVERGVSMDQVRAAMSQPSFQYYHDGAWKTGFYDPASRVCVGSVNNIITTVINNVKPQYIQSLQKAHP